jgi:hypothetical protein
MKHASDIRRKSAKIRKYAGELDEDVDEIKDAISNYQTKLKDAVAGIEDTK